MTKPSPSTKRRKVRAKPLTKDERRRKRATERRLALLNRAMKEYGKTKRIDTVIPPSDPWDESDL